MRSPSHQTLRHIHFYLPSRRSDIRRCYVLMVAVSLKANQLLLDVAGIFSMRFRWGTQAMSRRRRWPTGSSGTSLGVWTLSDGVASCMKRFRLRLKKKITLEGDSSSTVRLMTFSHLCCEFEDLQRHHDFFSHASTRQQAQADTATISMSG